MTSHPAEGTAESDLPDGAAAGAEGIEALLRLAAVAVAGAGLLAGVAGAAVAGLLRQARTTEQLIEHYQEEAFPTAMFGVTAAHGPADGSDPTNTPRATDTPRPTDTSGRGRPDPELAEAAMAAARADGSFTPRASGAVGGPGQRAADAAAQLRLPEGDGVYGPEGRLLRTGEPVDALRLAMLGDSTSVGFGCTTVDELPGVMLARGVARAAGRPVGVHTVGTVGVGAADLDRQLDLVLPNRPDAVIILVGANDIRDKVPPQQSARALGAAVDRAVRHGVPVVVGTCPDFGVIQAIPQPLRALLRSWSHRLAELQARETDQAGGDPVLLGRLVSPEFAGRPDLFAADRFHPSGAGYARAVAALLPVLLRALPDSEPATGHAG